MVDLYKTNAGLKELARQHPNNRLLAGRGPPGTHDIKLAVKTLSAVQLLEAENAEPLQLPIFDKSLCGGEGERSAETVHLQGPINVFILEGWSIGFSALPPGDLKKLYDNAVASDDDRYFTAHSLDSLTTLNEYISDFGNRVYPTFSTIVQIEPTRYEDVFAWRLEQEHTMKAKNGGVGMTDEQVHRFVERYMPGYELWKEGIWADHMPWAGNGLRLFFGSAREVIRVVKPTGSFFPGDKQLAPAESLHTLTPVRVPVPASSSRSRAVIPSTSDNVPKSMPSRPSNPNWSRKSLSAESPLDPTYDHVPSIATLHQDSLILKSTPRVAFFPIQGPGGRLGVHPLNKKGRIAVGGEGYLSGGVEMTDFAVEIFRKEGGGRVAMAGEDGVIRVWQVDVDGVQGAGPDPQLMLKGV